jgi:hypothetical protein
MGDEIDAGQCRTGLTLPETARIGNIRVDLCPFRLALREFLWNSEARAPEIAGFREVNTAKWALSPRTAVRYACFA